MSVTAQGQSAQAVPTPRESVLSRTYRALRKSFGVFTDEKMLRNPVLNMLGLQVWRVLLAHAFFRVRRFFFSSRDPLVRELLREGVVAIPNFLSEEDFAAFQAEFARRMRPEDRGYRKFLMGDSLIEKIEPGAESRDVCALIAEDPRLVHMLNAAEARRVNLKDELYFETVTFQVDDAENVDGQRYLHRDIFFPAHKVLFAIDEIGEDDGPFAYVPRTHRPKARRLWMEYFFSARRKIEPNLRLKHGEEERFRLQERKMTAAANTLIIADVNGMHRRVPARPGTKRRMARMSLRRNPFRII